jgi:hypothetical protein
MNPLRAWNRFWFGPISARPLGVFRVAFGLILLAHLAIVSVDFDHWYTDAGLLRGTEARETAGPWRPSVLQWVQDPASVHLFFAATVAVTVAFTLGWKTRLMGVLTYLAMLSLHHRNILPDGGQDNFLVILCFYAMLCPCGAAFSLDARRAAGKRGTLAEPLIVPWAQRLIQLQICLIYIDTVMVKCTGTAWLNGTALHAVIFNEEVRRINIEFLAGYPILINFLTYAALAIEISLPFLLWSRTKRPGIIWGGVALHVGIMLLVNAPLFGEMMIAAYVLFMAPDEIDRLLRRLNPLGWFAERSLPRWLLSARLKSASELSAWRQLELGFPSPEEPV